MLSLKKMIGFVALSAAHADLGDDDTNVAVEVPTDVVQGKATAENLGDDDTNGAVEVPTDVVQGKATAEEETEQEGEMDIDEKVQAQLVRALASGEPDEDEINHILSGMADMAGEGGGVPTNADLEEVLSKATEAIRGMFGPTDIEEPTGMNEEQVVEALKEVVAGAIEAEALAAQEEGGNADELTDMNEEKVAEAIEKAIEGAVEAIEAEAAQEGGDADELTEEDVKAIMEELATASGMNVEEMAKAMKELATVAKMSVGEMVKSMKKLAKDMEGVPEWDLAKAMEARRDVDPQTTSTVKIEDVTDEPTDGAKQGSSFLKGGVRQE